jgi:hypothetical protein
MRIELESLGSGRRIWARPSVCSALRMEGLAVPPMLFIVSSDFVGALGER